MTSLRQRLTLGKAYALEGWGFTLYACNSPGNRELVYMIKTRNSTKKKKGSKDNKCFPFCCAVLYLKPKDTHPVISKQSQPLLMTLTG